MIAFTRDLARRFRAVAQKCVAGRPRGPAPPVVCRADHGVLTLTCRFDGVVLSLSAPARPGSGGTLVVPMAVLEAVEGAGGDPVELRPMGGLKGEAVWADRGVPRPLAFDALKPGRQHDPIPEPAAWGEVPPRFLLALHECGRTTARDPGRFALHRVQVRGRAGQVAGTDGRTALIAAGFTLPFAADVLVAAVPVFGCRELNTGPGARVGHTAGHLVVRSGPWTVWLAADAGGRFPDVAGVVPAGTGGAVVGIDDRDAAALVDVLPGLPGAEEDGRPVTLELDGTAAVRAKGVGGVVELRLSRSAVAGPPARVALDRAVLRRAMRLGLTTVRTPGGGKPVVFEGADFTLVAVALGSASEAGPEPGGTVTVTDPVAPAAVTTTLRRSTMKPHETNGHLPNGRHDPPPDAPDPLAEAEALRAALAEAAGRAARLVAALKARKKEQRALASVWTSLKTLNLGRE